MTFKDFIYKCENYEYSNEYYDIMKESSEALLIENYLDNQRFISLNPISESVSEGYFVESVNDDTIKGIMESSEEKKKNIFRRIWEKIINALKIVVNFFKNLIHKNTNKQKSEGLKSKLSTGVNNSDVLIFTEEEINDIFTKLGIDGNTIDYKNSFIKSYFNEAIKNNESNMIKIIGVNNSAQINDIINKIKFPDNISESKLSVFKDMIILSLNNEAGVNFKITSECLSQNNGEYCFINEIELGKNINKFNTIISSYNKDSISIDTILTEFNNIKNEIINSKSLTSQDIAISNSISHLNLMIISINNTIKSLESIIDQVNSIYSRELDNTLMKYDPKSPNKKQASKRYNDLKANLNGLNEILLMLNKASGNTVKIYSEFLSFVSSIIDIFYNKFINIDNSSQTND